VPSHAELKQIMALHGGNFETYFSRDRVTHFVCAHLPDTKLKQLAANPRRAARAAQGGGAESHSRATPGPLGQQPQPGPCS
jgi:DNA repair protein REV1